MQRDPAAVRMADEMQGGRGDLGRERDDRLRLIGDRHRTGTAPRVALPIVEQIESEDAMGGGELGLELLPLRARVAARMDENHGRAGTGIAIGNPPGW